MRRFCIAAVASMAFAVATGSPIAAQTHDADPSVPTVIYGTSPVVIAVPPTGYPLDPSDMRKPIYVVNEDLRYPGPGIYAVPTYSEGGYAFAEPYPYWPYPYGYPYIRSYGYGPYYHFHALRPYGYRQYPRGIRPYGYMPHGAYRYQPAPSAKIIQVPPLPEWTSLR